MKPKTSRLLERTTVAPVRIQNRFQRVSCSLLPHPTVLPCLFDSDPCQGTVQKALAGRQGRAGGLRCALATSSAPVACSDSRQLARAAEGPQGIAPRSRAAVHPVLYFVEGVSRLGRDLVRIDRELDGLRVLGMGVGMGTCTCTCTCMCMLSHDVHVHDVT